MEENLVKREKKILKILKRNELSNTETRRYVLNMFLNTNKAISHADIEKHAADQLDRVTVYRTLQAFLEKRIIHTIPTNDNRILYALCNHEGEEHGHEHVDKHVHFICSVCNNTQCLDSVSIPEVNLPPQFVVSSSQMLIKGICDSCNAAH
jgi:Fur family transcriptional regulator, ferric uptake regulator